MAHRLALSRDRPRAVADVHYRPVAFGSLTHMAGGNSPTLDQALALLRQGRRVEGETLLLRAAERESDSSRKPFLNGLSGRSRGDAAAPVSREHAAALYDLARYLPACDR